VALEQVFFRAFLFYPDNRHSTITPYSSITAAHYHTIGAKLGASVVIRHLAGLGVRVV
jgi:hypothetical protein